MLKIFEIINRHFEELEHEIMENVAGYAVSSQPDVKFEDLPSYAKFNNYLIRIGDEKRSYSLSIALLSKADERANRIEEALKEIAEKTESNFLKKGGD